MASNFFRKPVPDLKPGTEYSFKFQWKYSDGTLGPFSVAKTVLTAGTATVEIPTKATGLTASAGAFSLLVSWAGTYENNDYFNGFKSINIYASTSDLGSSTTTNLESKIVGSMNVDAVKNSSTISLENLKSALSILSSVTLYSTDIYLYYISVNENNEKYQESGQNTYYRINDTALRVLQANYIDIAEGVISIEKLTASTGQFLAYLRAGIRASDGTGARVEISGSSTNQSPPTYIQDGVTRGGGTIYPGLTIYNTDGTVGFKASTTGDVTFSGVLKSITQEGFTPLVSTHDAYIQIPKNSSQIDFYPTSINGGTNAGKPGYIRVYETPSDPGDPNSYEIAAVEIKPPTYKTNLEASSASILITEKSNLDTFVNIIAKYVTIDSGSGGLTLNSNLYTVLNTSESYGAFIGNNTPVNQTYLRNIKATTSAPSAGSSASSSSYYYGDIWFQYTN